MRSSILLLLALTACRAGEKTPPASGDSTSATDSTASTVFGILSPKAGDTLTEGATYIVHWSAAGVTRINVGVAMGGKDRGHLLLDAPAAPDSFAWAVPVGFVTGFGLAASSDMRLRLEDAADPSHFADTKPFTIVGSHQ